MTEKRDSEKQRDDDLVPRWADLRETGEATS